MSEGTTRNGGMTGTEERPGLAHEPHAPSTGTRSLSHSLSSTTVYFISELSTGYLDYP
jgi:hypothetical protein